NSGFIFIQMGCLKPIGFFFKKFFAIFAFGTAGGYSGKTNVTVKCSSQVSTVTASFGYPFRMNVVSFNMPKCDNSTESETLYLQGDFSSSPEFFVTIGVFAFLYCMGALVFYLGYRHWYLENSRWPAIDFFVTFLFAVMWLISSSAWAKALTDVKTVSSPSRIIEEMREVCKLPEVVCNAGATPAMGRLNASVIFGFLNLILWAGNCWFVFKETSWHKVPDQQSSAEEGANKRP
uniref:Synaptophysin like 2 n=1 Tax=Latimeria chalumnae TaxID=7897 RepID=H3B8W0_LATCH